MEKRLHFQSIKRHFYILVNIFRLKINKVKYGNNCRIFNDFYISNKGTISIGNDFLMLSGGGV